MRRIIKLFLTIAIILLFNNSFAQTAVHPNVVKTAIDFSISQPVRNMPTVSETGISSSNEEEMERNEEMGNRNYPNPDPLPNGIDPVLQTTSRTQTRSSYSVITHNFDGQTSGSYPPDCSGSIGPNYFFEAYNVSFAIYDKNTEQLVAGPTDYNTLFEGVTGAEYNNGDPIILYDEQADRWFASEFSLGTEKYMLIAVSVTNDPTGQWYRWSFDMGTTTPDYMKFGVWRDGYYMAINRTGDDDVYVFERDAMLNGDSNPRMVGFDNPYRPNSGFHCIMPLDNDGPFAPTGTPGQFMTINDGAWQSGTSDQIWVYELNVDWNDVSNSTFDRVQQIDVPAFDSNFGSDLDNISQPGTSQELDAVPQILMYRVQYRNFGNTQTVVACHTVDVDGTDHAGVRWYELQNTGSGWSIRQSGTYAPDGASRWIPSIAMNADHEIGLAYSIADDNSIYPGIRFVGQSAAENATASGVLDIPETVVVDGGTYQASYNRWGDYAQMSIDPDDDKTFWFNTEYMQSSTSTKGTRIVAFKYQQDNDPSALTATPISYSQIDLSWAQNSDSDPVLLAWSADGTFGTPQDGQTYSPGDAISGGGTVLYYGSNTDFSHTGLTENTRYYYKAWSYTSSNEYSAGVTTNAITPYAPISNYPFTLDFENSTDYTTSFAPWTTFDGNGTATYGSGDVDFPGEGTAFAYMAMNPQDCGWTSANGDTAHNGQRCGMSICPSDASQTDHWFISPQLELGTNSSFSLWVLTAKAGSWGNESYEVMVSTTDNNPSSFTSISGPVDVPETWTQHTYDLSAYDNQTIYLAIHHIATDKFMFWIDELEINSQTSSCISPSITQQPNNVSVCEGDNATFTVVADGTNPIYQWRFNGNDISGANADTYTITNVTASEAGNYTCYVSNSCGNVTSNVATLSINDNTSITQQPSNITVCNGDNATFTVSATGTNLSYQWQFNGSNISNATSSSYTINNVSSTNAGNYTCVITGDCGSVTSNTASLSVNDNTAITQQPSDADVCEGDNATFTVSATGTNLSYQWQFNGNNIAGATSSSYTVNSVSSSDLGDYSCVVTGDCGTVTSNTATLSTNSGITITQQPSDADVCEGSNVTFTVSATGNNISYQWQFNGNNISGATNDTYTISNISNSDAGDYTCVLTGDCGSVTSNSASLTIGSGVTITSQPTGGSYCEGSIVDLSVSATGTNLSYQWQFNGNNIAGATSSTYTINNLSSNQTGDYVCEITSQCGTQTTNVANVSLIPQTVITSQPVGANICEGEQFTLVVNATGSNLSYQWQLNGNNIAGATSSTYSATANANTVGNYTCDVSGDCGTVLSNPANVQLNQFSITQQPQDLTKCDGDDAIFTIATSTNNVTYQWYFNGNAISGANQSYYLINNVATSDAGQYSCEVNNECNSPIISNTAQLTVNDAPVITSQPVSLDANVGDDVSFTVVANGNNLTYQWNKNGLALTDGGNISGSATSTLNIANVTDADYGNYDCDISGDCGNVSSDVAVLTVITSVETLEQYGVNISPNPSNGTFTIRLSNSSEPMNVKVLDVNGQVIYNKHFDNVKSKTIDLSSHSKGIYFIELQLNDNTVRAKLIFK